MKALTEKCLKNIVMANCQMEEYLGLTPRWVFFLMYEKLTFAHDGRLASTGVQGPLGRMPRDKGLLSGLRKAAQDVLRGFSLVILVFFAPCDRRVVTVLRPSSVRLWNLFEAWRLRRWVGSGDGLGRRWSAVALRLFCVAGVALGDICLRFVWDAWRLVTSAFVLCSRRGTHGTGSGDGLGRRWSPVASRLFFVASVALGDICLRFVWQGWHLRHCVGSGDGLGRRWSPVAPRLFCVAGVALGCVGSGDGLGRRWSPVAPRLFCVAGVALGDICLRIVWQAWHLRHWAGSGDGLGRRWSSVAPRLFCGAGVALGDICLRFVWQAWHLVTSAFVLFGRRGTHGTGLALVTAFVAAGRLWRRAWRLVASALLLRGRRGAYGAGLAVSEAMPILLAMLMLRGPKLIQVRTAALDALQCSLPLASGARSLSAFLAAGGLFVLLSMLSPSTKQGSEAEVERAAELFEDLLAQHGGVLCPLLEECQPSSLLQKLARDSRSSAKTKQHALAGRRALERPAELTGLPGPRPPKAPGMDTRRLQSAGAQAVGGYSPPSGRLSRTSSPSRLLPGGMTLRLLLDERRPDPGSETMLSALAEYEAKVTNASEVALCELASDSGGAELAAAGLKRQRSYLPHLSVILGKFAGHPKAKSIFAQLLSKYLRLCDALEALPSCWPHVPATMRPAVLELLEEGFHSSQATASDARALLASLQDSSVPMELQAFVLQLLRKVLDPNAGRKAHSELEALSPKAVNGALMAAMPKHPLLCLEVLGTTALKEFWHSSCCAPPRRGAARRV
eukprot:s118_g18.t1